MSQCAGFSLQGLLIVEHRVKGMQASEVAPFGLSSYDSCSLEHRLGSCGAQAYLLFSMWDPTQPGIKPVSPALAGRLFTTEPSGKPEKKS